MTDIPDPRAGFIRHRAQAAADAAQQWHDLEVALAASMDREGVALNRAELAEAANRLLQEELVSVKRDLDHYKNENTEIDTELRMAAKILLAIRDRRRRGPEAYAPHETPELQAAAADRPAPPNGRPRADDGAAAMAMMFAPKQIDHFEGSQ